MLVANNRRGRVEAEIATRDDSFVCPNCTRQVILKRGEIRIAHFAHRPAEGCEWSVGETLEHLSAKKIMCDTMRQRGLKAEVEFPVLNRRADVAVWFGDKLGVIELQHSNIPVELLDARINDYLAANVYQLWVPFGDGTRKLRPYEDHLLSFNDAGIWFWNPLDLQRRLFNNMAPHRLCPIDDLRVVMRSRHWMNFVAEGTHGGCIIPLRDPGDTLARGLNGEPIRCGKFVPRGRGDRLCDEHYAPVSDAAVARQIAKSLASKWWES